MPTFKVGDKIVRIKHFKPKVPQGVVFVVKEVVTYGSSTPTDWDIRLESLEGVWSPDYFALHEAGVPKVSGQYAVGDVVVRTKGDSVIYHWMKKGAQYTVGKVMESGHLVFKEDPDFDGVYGCTWNTVYFEHVSLTAAEPEQPPMKFKIGDKVVCTSAAYENEDEDTPAYWPKGKVGTITNMASQGTIICLDNVQWCRNSSEFELATGNEKPVVKPRYVVYNCHSM